MKKALNFKLALQPLFWVYAVSGSVKPTSWRGQKCYHCESEKRNTLRDSVNIDGSEDWKCFDCGRWFKL
jgi:hypothetical protein